MKGEIPRPAFIAILLLLLLGILGAGYMALNRQEAPLERQDLGRGGRDAPKK